MPFNDIPTKEQQIESFLQLWLRKFLPTLGRTPAYNGAESTDIHLWPVHQGSQMPQVSPTELTGRANERNRKALDRLYQQGGPA